MNSFWECTFILFKNDSYKTSGLSIFGALAVSQVAVNSGLAFYNPGLCFIGGLVGGLGGILGTAWTQPEFLTEMRKSNNNK